MYALAYSRPSADSVHRHAGGKFATAPGTPDVYADKPRLVTLDGLPQEGSDSGPWWMHLLAEIASGLVEVVITALL